MKPSCTKSSIVVQRQEAACHPRRGSVRKSFFLFLASVIGGTAWLLVQNGKLPSLAELKLPTKAGQEATGFPVSTSASTGGEVIRIATFNIQVFGTKKIGNPVVMDVVTKIVRNFDVAAIQEIRSVADDIMPRF